MITISRVYEKFKIKCSNPGSGTRGFSVLARDIDGVHTAIDHYYARPHDKESCPLCQKGEA